MRPVVDGDTIECEGFGPIRLIGIDTPERGRPGYTEATGMTESLVLGKEVEVEICPVKSNDRYGRWRAVVYYTHEGNKRNLNTDLLALGYAQVYTLMPCHVDSSEWTKYVREAREAGQGLWAQDGLVPAGPSYHRGPAPREPTARGDHYIGNRVSRKFHKPTCRWLPTTNAVTLRGSRKEIIAQGYTPCKRCNP